MVDWRINPLAAEFIDCIVLYPNAAASASEFLMVRVLLPESWEVMEENFSAFLFPVRCIPVYRIFPLSKLSLSCSSSADFVRYVAKALVVLLLFLTQLFSSKIIDSLSYTKQNNRWQKKLNCLLTKWTLTATLTYWLDHIELYVPILVGMLKPQEENILIDLLRPKSSLKSTFEAIDVDWIKFLSKDACSFEGFYRAGTINDLCPTSAILRLIDVNAFQRKPRNIL